MRSAREPESLESGAIRAVQEGIRPPRGRVPIRRWIGDGVGESATGQGRSRNTRRSSVTGLKSLKFVIRFLNDGSQ